MKIRMILTLCFVLTLAHQSVFSQEAAPSSPAPVVASTAPPQVQRDPFWPVGYRPGQETFEHAVSNRVDGSKGPGNTGTAVTPATPRVIVITWPNLKIKGLIKQSDGSHLAIIDGVGIVEPGQTISILKDNMVFKIKIKDVTEKGVYQQKLDYKPYVKKP
ncbi:MAG: hypothetical protein PHR77_08945 [Kiritimatiellae bacterium]|nr:hypothetical protein [Kiritimatiellia bacterium]MDD5522868.1 hypothetical protein [Kiritimatiellia bacterium]